MAFFLRVPRESCVVIPGTLLAIITILLVSMVSSASIHRVRKSVEAEAGSQKENSSSSTSPIPTSIDKANGTTTPVDKSNGTLPDSASSSVPPSPTGDDDVIYAAYRGPFYPFDIIEDDDDSTWLWALDEALQKRREAEELDDFADELEEFYSNEDEEDDEEYDEGDDFLDSEYEHESADDDHDFRNVKTN